MASKGISEFSKAVGEQVLQDYGLEDGADLCYNLVEQGVIEIVQGENEAARIVAMHMEQA